MRDRSDHIELSVLVKVDRTAVAWRRALEEALRAFLDCPDEVIPIETEGMYSAIIERRGQDEARVDWLPTGEMRCTCQEAQNPPCRHMARVWTALTTWWSYVTHLASKHGLEAAIRWAQFEDTGAMDSTPLRPVRDVRLWRDASGAYADVPHDIRYSMMVEWGYEGAGPAELAYSILLYFYGPAVAERYYQEFQREVIARIPRDARVHVLPGEVVREWVERKAEEDGNNA